MFRKPFRLLAEKRRRVATWSGKTRPSRSKGSDKEKTRKGLRPPEGRQVHLRKSWEKKSMTGRRT